MRFILALLGLLLWSMPAWALTNGTGTVGWTPTTDPTIRYELRWGHFANGYAWLPLASNLDSTKGTYALTFPPFADSTGDRGICVDARAVRGTVSSPWVSATGGQACTQIPLTVVPTPLPVPVPIPIPVPPPTGLTISQATPTTIVIVASKVDCPRIVTSTKGTTTTQLRRTVTCTP